MPDDKPISELFGCMVFNDEAMRRYLSPKTYRELSGIIARGGALDKDLVDETAKAMMKWAVREKGATHYTHWFQPLTGVTAEKHIAFLSPRPGGLAEMEFSKKELICGEPDASSFPSGGLRTTFEARGYTDWDAASYAFVKDGTLYIPTVFVSHTKEALDMKLPLLRSMKALDEQCRRILRLLPDAGASLPDDGDPLRVTPKVGAEQEYFLIRKEYYDRRRDLVYCGRTLFGAPAPKGQEMGDNYFGSLKPKVAAFMDDLDEELWKVGVSAKTEHNEAAPSQHELAPVYGTVNTAVDQNLLTMEFMRLVAARHGLVCLLHEKPYAGINGSAKHINWSLWLQRGGADGDLREVNLFERGGSLGERVRFLLFLTAVVAAVDERQDLLRMSVASPGNDRRLGGLEAPPAVISVFLGEDLTDLLSRESGEILSLLEEEAREEAAGRPSVSRTADTVDLEVASIPSFSRDKTDRNRTSPFAFTGNKFEFRSPGSSQNIAMPNIVLNTAVAKVLRDMGDRLDPSGQGVPAPIGEVVRVIRDTFAAHRRIVFNGNSYSAEWTEEVGKRGLFNRTSIEAVEALDSRENAELFKSFRILSRGELCARKEILLRNYARTLHIEARTMLVMAFREIIPAAESYVAKLGGALEAKRRVSDDPSFVRLETRLITRLSELNAAVYEAAEALDRADQAASARGDALSAARAFRDDVLPAMAALRAPADEMETLVAAEDWPLPTYGEMTQKQ